MTKLTNADRDHLIALAKDDPIVLRAIEAMADQGTLLVMRQERCDRLAKALEAIVAETNIGWVSGDIARAALAADRGES